MRMYRSFGRLIGVLGVLLFALSASMGAIRVNLDGSPMSFKVPPQEIQGTILVPMRDVFEAMGATVNWFAPTKTITVTKGGTVVQLAIGSTEATVNGAPYALTSPAMTLDDVTLVPLRFVGEAFGYKVIWDAKLQMIFINSTPPATTDTKGTPDANTGTAPAAQPVAIDTKTGDAAAPTTAETTAGNTDTANTGQKTTTATTAGNTDTATTDVKTTAATTSSNKDTVGGDAATTDQATPADAGAAGQTESPAYTAEELDKLLGPIALYPDPLLAQILPAATFPDQLTEAAEYCRNGYRDVDAQPWDVSVKAVAHYPTRVLYKMADNPSQTTALGQAFDQQPTDVMAAVQRLRRQALNLGYLVSNRYQQVTDTDGEIQIEPADRLIYVPTYDPQVVYVRRSTTPDSTAIAFGFGLLIGVWLNRDCDWHQHTVYYHGWDDHRGGWVSRSRPYVKVENVYYVNTTYSHQPVVVNHDIHRFDINAYRDSVRHSADSHTLPHETVGQRPVIRPRVTPDHKLPVKTDPRIHAPTDPKSTTGTIHHWSTTTDSKSSTGTIYHGSPNDSKSSTSKDSKATSTDHSKTHTSTSHSSGSSKSKDKKDDNNEKKDDHKDKDDKDKK